MCSYALGSFWDEPQSEVYISESGGRDCYFKTWNLGSCSYLKEFSSIINFFYKFILQRLRKSPFPNKMKFVLSFKNSKNCKESYFTTTMKNKMPRHKPQRPIFWDIRLVHYIRLVLLIAVCMNCGWESFLFNSFLVIW